MSVFSRHKDAAIVARSMRQFGNFGYAMLLVSLIRMAEEQAEEQIPQLERVTIAQAAEFARAHADTIHEGAVCAVQILDAEGLPAYDEFRMVAGNPKFESPQHSCINEWLFNEA